jgi:hypothetical protein
MDVTLCVLLWARDGRDADLRRYEDQVLALLADHDGQVIQRAQVTGGDGTAPREVQILRLGSQSALEATRAGSPWPASATRPSSEPTCSGWSCRARRHRNVPGTPPAYGKASDRCERRQPG